jgi:DNA cross-link repair 1A protein
MTALFELKPDTLATYLSHHPSFTHIAGFRPSGWSYKPPAGRLADDSVPVHTILYGDSWKSPYSVRDMAEMRGCQRNVKCWAVPYSEHSSFRELAMFACALDWTKVVPTVNVGSRKARERMKAWAERWMKEREKNGPFRLAEEGGRGLW